MKQISTGTGLVVLSITILASVFLSSPRTATTAFASAQQAQPAERSVGRKADAAPSVAMAAGCESQIWFNPQPHEFLSGCSDVAALPITPADVDRDGFQEIFISKKQIIASGVPIAPLDFGNSLDVSGIEISPEGVTPRQSNVFQLDSAIANIFISQLPDLGDPNRGPNMHSWEISANPVGWLDCDSDGDLDMVMEIVILKVNGNCNWMDPCAGGWGGGSCGSWQCNPMPSLFSTHRLWFENTGFQHTASLEGDLNGDGHVDSEDLGRLLGGYTG